jgi:hypothetical protein
MVAELHPRAPVHLINPQIGGAQKLGAIRPARTACTDVATRHDGVKEA